MSYYTSRIKVVGEDKMCFPVNARTLEAESCGSYDPHAWCDPDPAPLETLDVAEWQRRLWALRGSR